MKNVKIIKNKHLSIENNHWRLLTWIVHIWRRVVLCTRQQWLWRAITSSIHIILQTIYSYISFMKTGTLNYYGFSENRRRTLHGRWSSCQSNLSSTEKDIEFIISNKVTHIINTISKKIPNLWERFGIHYLSVNWAENEQNVRHDILRYSIRKIMLFRLSSSSWRKPWNWMNAASYILSMERLGHALLLLLTSWKSINGP